MKTVLYIGNFTQMLKTTPRDNYVTVQQYNYTCVRSRNDAGFPYGPVLTTIMEFTIRLQLPEDSKVFHQRMHDNSAYPYSFIFDPVFSDTGAKTLKDFSSATIASGHIIDVEETLDAKPDSNGTSKQVEVHIKLLLSEIVYIGKTQMKKMVFKQEAPEEPEKQKNPDTPITPGNPSGDGKGEGDGNGDKGNDDGKKSDTPSTPEAEPEVSFSKYALFIGDQAEAQGIAKGITHSVSKTFKKDSYSVVALLKSLSYHKKIFQPVEIRATLSLTWTGTAQPSHSFLTKVFLNQRAELKVYDKAANLDKIIAKNCFVFQMNPRYKTVSNSSSMDLELCIFSLDKLLTLDKYSKAYTGKRLGKDIFTQELTGFSVNGMTITGWTDNMQFLKLSNGEMRIPYAVQYNETFYDFLRRIAMRYGEFLYFENGKLRLGLNTSEDNYWTDSKKDTAKDWASVTILKERYYESMLSNAITVENEYFPYLERKGKKSTVYVKGDVRNETDDSIKEHHFYNPDPISSDEYLSAIEKDGYTSTKEKYKYFEKFIMEDFFKVLESTSLAGILSNIVVTEGMRAIKMVVKVKDDNDLFNQQNIKPYEDTKYNDQKDGNKLKPFTNYIDNTALSTKVGKNIVSFTSNFYNIIRAKEKKVAEGAVYLYFGEHTQPFSLGDKINLGGTNGTDYIIVEIEGQAEKEEEVYKDTQRVVAVPIYDKVIIPPALPDIPLIREAKPQRAIIALSTTDPKKLGRVRIRYPWQGEKEMASPWIRVALPLATSGGAVNFRPEYGDEAMIDYENGNIDKPFVAGYLTSPFIKEDWGSSVIPDRGLMSKNGHTVSFKDPLDGMNFFWGMLPVLGTIKSFVPTMNWPSALKEKDNKKIVDLTGGTTITDRYGLYKISASSDERKIEISSPMGDVSINAFTGIKINAPNGDISIVGKNVSIKAANNLTIQSGDNLKNRYADKDFFKDLGAGLLNGVSKVVEKAIDISFLRSVLEVFMRPIDGTLKIKSTTFVMMEAGPGRVEVPRGSYNKAPKDYLSDDDFRNQGEVFPKLKNTISAISLTVDSLVNGFTSDYVSFRMRLNEFKIWQTANDPQAHIITIATIKAKASANRVDDSTTLSITEADLNANAAEIAEPPQINVGEEPQRNNYPEGDAGEDQYNRDWWTWNNTRHQMGEGRRTLEVLKKRKLKKDAMEKATNLLRAYNDMRLSAKYWRELNPLLPHGVANDKVYVNEVLNPLIQQGELKDYPLKVADAQNLNIPDDDLIGADLLNADAIERTILKRKMAYKMMSIPAVKELFKVKDLTEPDYANDKSWGDFAKNVFTDNTVGTKVKDWFYDHYAKPFVDFGNVFYRNKMWGPEVKGQILFSDNPSKTISFSRTGMFDNNNLEQISSRYDTEIKRILGDVR